MFWLTNKSVSHAFLPYVDENYRTTSERILFGWEFAGAYVIESLISKPEFFSVLFVLHLVFFRKTCCVSYPAYSRKQNNSYRNQHIPICSYKNLYIRMSKLGSTGEQCSVTTTNTVTYITNIGGTPAHSVG